jgi:hypothetical protein
MMRTFTAAAGRWMAEENVGLENFEEKKKV